MEDRTKSGDCLQALLANLKPEELEPRLELQLFFDPLASLGCGNNQNNGNQQQQSQDRGSGS